MFSSEFKNAREAARLIHELQLGRKVLFSSLLLIIRSQLNSQAAS